MAIAVAQVRRIRDPWSTNDARRFFQAAALFQALPGIPNYGKQAVAPASHQYGVPVPHLSWMTWFPPSQVSDAPEASLPNSSSSSSSPLSVSSPAFHYVSFVSGRGWAFDPTFRPRCPRSVAPRAALGRTSLIARPSYASLITLAARLVPIAPDWPRGVVLQEPRRAARRRPASPRRPPRPVVRLVPFALDGQRGVTAMTVVVLIVSAPAPSASSPSCSTGRGASCFS